MGETENISRLILLLEGPDRTWEELADRVERLGFQTLRVETIEEAEQILEHAEPQIHCAMLPVEFADRRLKRALKGLRKRAPEGGLRLIAVGPEPERAARRHLRAASVLNGLWEPFADETLRFQLNHLSCPDEPAQVRDAARVPTDLSATATAGGRDRDAHVYSLSETGAYLRTNRACMDGAKISVRLQLPSGPISLPALVVFTNVVGNLQRSNLPLGMGVRFPELPQAEALALRDYVEERRSQLAV